MPVRAGDDPFLVVQLAFQDAQARVRQAAGVTPAQQFLALRVDDGPAGLQRGLASRLAPRRAR